ncbi:MAG: pentapeptide repeat-containing protein [Gammaproteobacteria bacterium]|nr:pentapeptide repeat-containing protein [Gammaproteobacteria bacterium]
MNWYIRKQNKISGPFPLKQLQQSILLGRLALADEVSKDKTQWLAVQQVAELIPAVLKADNTDPVARERLAAARRWADERRNERRDSSEHERIGPGRREPEGYSELEYRFQRESTLVLIKKQRERIFGGVVLVVLVLGAAVFAGLKFIPTPVSGAQCNAKPAAAVNWSNCNLQALQAIKADLQHSQLMGANLATANLFGSNLNAANISYAIFFQANLSYVELQNGQAKGTDFTGADLTNANLSHSDLSYANFKLAKLNNTHLEGANLAHAIWIDGVTCLAGSIGKCVTK